MFDLIIFDCDGVLVDSEHLTNTVFAQMLNELGIPVTLEDMFEQFVGNSMSRCVELIEELLGKPIPEGFIQEYTNRTAIALNNNLKPVDGIVEVLSVMETPYCVASSGDHNKMQTTLGITNLFSHFEGRLFSVTEVARGKPYPDVFLYAAEKMGVEPAKCAVVEDTPIGARAGIAAGMKVFGYAKLTPAHKLEKEGAILFEDMRQLPYLLKQQSVS
ncbi:HAD family hydrolase [Anabaena sp. CCY 0017]|uniref:HAD family hydrolase n=1 Tax=Anabaena sp. CCY 0017 TaxID=3103866 RepID=UPI0039C64CA8